MLVDYAALFVAILLTSYLVPAVVFLLVPRFLGAPRIQARAPAPGQVRAEVIASLRVIAVYALSGLALRQAFLAGHTALTVEWTARSWWVQPLAFAACVVLHDTWFYWVHRAMHWGPLYRWLHAGHHRSVTPTPWSSRAFDIAETIPQCAIVTLLACLLPLHWLTLWAYLFFEAMVNTAGHCGFEIIPRAQGRHWLLRYTYAVTHHDLHHARFRYNFAQYFSLWDRLCGTFRDR